MTKWTFCPECGSKDYTQEDAIKACTNCNHPWFPDVNYLNVVRENLRVLWRLNEIKE